MRVRWTDDARVCLHPFSTYSELAAGEAPSLLQALTGPALLAFGVACFVSWTTAGRLLLDHLLLAPLSWAWVPAIQVTTLMVVARSWRIDKPWRLLVGLYFRGHGPWLLVIALLSLLCLLPAGTWPAYRFLIASGGLAMVLVGAMAWCVVTTLAFFHAVVAGTRRRTAAVTLSFYAVQITLGVAYYAATEQIQPLLGLIP